MIKEYITTYDPARGGAYLRNIGGLTKKEVKKIANDYISIEPEEDILTVSVFPVSYSTVSIATTRKNVTREEPRMHPVSHGIIVNNKSVSVELKRMEKTGFSFLNRELDEHDNPVCEGKHVEKKAYPENHTKQDDARKLDDFYRVIKIIENKEKVLLRMDKTERTQWLVSLYDVLLPEMINKIFISMGECPVNPPDILIGDTINVQNNEDEYEKENLHQFEKEGHFFRKKYGNFPRLEKNIINNNSEGKRKLKKCYYIRCKYKLARYDGAENIRDVLEEYEILLELLEREQSEDPKNINVWLCQLRKCFVSEDLFRRMLESEFPFLDNSQQIQQVPVTTNIKKDLADECMEYVVKNKMPAGFQEINSQDEWKEFQLKIRRKLLKHELRKGEYERFVTVLFWAFQYSADGKAIRQGNLLWSSYDLREICIFIQRLKFPLNLKLGKAVKTRLFE